MKSATVQEKKRDFYLFGHACNDIPSINKALKQKVNGIECDLWMDEDKKWWISHDGSEKTDLVKWLTHIKKSEKKFGQQLTAIIFDIKPAEPIVATRELINSILPDGVRRIYSTAKIEKAHIFSEIVSLLAHNEVIAIDEEDDPAEVAAFFRDLGATQCWYGNGITLVPINSPFHEAMQKAAPIRDSTGPYSKIYTWTVHRKEALRKYMLEDKVDAVLVGLNNIWTRPVSSALRIIKANAGEVQLADRNSPLFYKRLPYPENA